MWKALKTADWKKNDYLQLHYLGTITVNVWMPVFSEDPCVTPEWGHSIHTAW